MKARFPAMAAVLLLVAILALCGTAWAAPGTAIDPSVLTELDAVNGAAVPVIVYAPGHLDDVASALPVPTDAQTLPLIGGVATTVTADQLSTLASLPYVQSIVADVPIFGTGVRGRRSTSPTQLSDSATSMPAVCRRPRRQRRDRGRPRQRQQRLRRPRRRLRAARG